MEDEHDVTQAAPRLPLPVPPAAYEIASSDAASGITEPEQPGNGDCSPRSVGVTTSQTKRLSDPAHVLHGKPSASVA